MGEVESSAALSDAVNWLARCATLPAAVEAKARLLLLDTLGCLVAGLRHPEVGQFAQSLAIAFPGAAAWPASEVKLSPAGLAALGAAAACWDEACEGNAAAHGRPGLPVVPALLALATTRDVGLGELLLALVTGYEIGARAGEVWRIPQGWHVDGGWHALGVAAAAARITAGPARMQDAIEAAACQIPASLYLPIKLGSVVRNTYPAHAALLGILAAAAAGAGFAMPRGALDEARRRVLQARGDAQAAPAETWTLLEGYLKPFAGVRHTHYGVEAALRLRRHPSFSLERIAAVRLATYAEAVQYCGNRAPRTAIQAQFSLSYAVAAALVLGDLGPEAYADLAHPDIVRLEQMIAVEIDPARSGRGAALTVESGGAQFSETVDSVAGDAGMPMSEAEVVAKFRRYASPALGAARAQALATFVLDGDAAQPAHTCFTVGT